MNEKEMRAALNKRTNSDLMSIATGLAAGYMPMARSIAEQLLRERDVALPDNLQSIRMDRAIHEERAELVRAGTAREEAGTQNRSLGFTLLVLGIGSFVLPFFGLQFRLVGALQLAIPFAGVLFFIAGIVLLSGTDKATEITDV